MTSINTGLLRTSWAGSGDTLDKKFGTYLRRKALDAFLNRIGIDEFADQEGIPSASGDKILFKRFVKKALQSTALTAGQNATATARSVQTVEASLSRYGDAEQISKEVLQTAIANLPEDIVQMFGIEAAESAERLVFTTIAPIVDNAFARLDSIGTNWTLEQTSSVVMGTAPTTVIRMKVGGKGQTTGNYWRRGMITFLEGKNAGVSRKITTSNSSADSITVNTAFEYAQEASVMTIIAKNVSHTLGSASQILSIAGTSRGAGLKSARMILEKAGAIPFQGNFNNFKSAAPEAPRGDYAAMVSPEQYLDLIGDTVFQTASQQGDSWKNKLASYQIVRFMGMLIHSNGLSHRTNGPAQGTAETATYVSGGPTHVASIMGMHSFAMVNPEGYGGKGKSGMKVYIKRPGPQSTDQSNDAFVTLGWDMWFGTRVLNGVWGFGLATSANY